MDDKLLNNLSNLLGNNPLLGKELIMLFADQTDKDLQSMQDALASGDLLSISKICHKMKSSLLALGLMEEANSMRDIEQACNEKKSIQEILPMVADCSKKVMKILNAIRSN